MHLSTHHIHVGINCNFENISLFRLSQEEEHRLENIKCKKLKIFIWNDVCFEHLLPYLGFVSGTTHKNHPSLRVIEVILEKSKTNDSVK